jgi:hypothetical protein
MKSQMGQKANLCEVDSLKRHFEHIKQDLDGKMYSRDMEQATEFMRN